MKDEKIRVLIVEESVLMGRVIQNILSHDTQIEVVGISKNGPDAIIKVKQLNPDVVIFDLEVPLMECENCLDYLMEQGTYAIIVISSFASEQANDTIRSLELGAFDFIDKPKSIFELSSEKKQKDMIKKVKLAYESLKRPGKINKQENKILKINPELPLKPVIMEHIIAVGVSTGGPRSLATILPMFPANFPAAMVVVQHMPRGFTASLAKRLNDNSSLIVTEAKDMDELQAGHVYIAPGDYHLTFKNNDNKVIIRLNQEPPIGGLRPNVDVMMKSLAEVDFNSIIGVIMTGMGSDGTKGIRRLKEKKAAYVIAQNEETSVVFGMPRSAIEQGLVDETVPLQDIPICVMNYMGVRR